MSSATPNSEARPLGVLFPGHSRQRTNRYRGGRYLGKPLKPLSTRHRNPNLRAEIAAPAPSTQQPSLRSLGRSWKARLYQHRLEQRFKDEPRGANLGLVFDYRKKTKIPYKKDYFSGAIRPRCMMDDLYDGMDAKRLRREEENWRLKKAQLESEELDVINEEVNGEDSIVEPDAAASDSEFSDWVIITPKGKAKGPVRSLDPNQDEKPPNVGSNQDKEETQLAPETSKSSPCWLLSSEESEEE
ncbi:hypothetical protein F5Y05DRAFT_267192 [Hypoxylon sp. FL0543]|nr:hypothetical protein F5Y05DRAFT_267192 [Hypoxylon sp. FL0543]